MGAMIKLAYLTGEYPRATDTFIQREVAGLRALGHEVFTCSIRKTAESHHVGPEQREEAARTFNVLRRAKNPVALIKAHVRQLLDAPRRYVSALKLALQTAQPGLKGLIYQLFYFAEAAVLAEQLHKQKVSHLHNHIAKSSCSVAMIASTMSGIPFSFTLHGPDIFFAPEQWRLDAKIREASFVACISHFARSQAMSFSAPDDWSKLHIVHCGVEIERYQGASADGAQLLFVGRLAAVKGLPVLLQAMAQLPSDVTLTIIGDGPDRSDLEAQVQDLELTDRVVFLGYRSQSEVADSLAQHDIFVLPSFAEGVPVVLMEAMAAERPVVTTRIAGVPELVEDGVSGLLVAPGDMGALQQALSNLLSNKALQQEMGRAGRQKVTAEFQTKNEAAWLSQLFESYCKAQPVQALRPTAEGDA